MRIERRFTTDGQSPYAGIEFRLTTSEIRNPDGSVVFRLDNVEVPQFWSQVASDVLAQKYFRKAGVPAALKKVEENSVPSFLWRSVPDTEALAAKATPPGSGAAAAGSHGASDPSCASKRGRSTSAGPGGGAGGAGGDDAGVFHGRDYGR